MFHGDLRQCLGSGKPATWQPEVVVHILGPVCAHSSASWEKSRPGLEEEQRRNYPSHGTVDRLFTLAGLVEDFLNT